MAKIMNFQMKNIKQTAGREGYGVTASLYLNGKRIGTYADYADGGPEDVEYVSKEAEQEMMKTIIAYAKRRPDAYISNLYRERPKQYAEECERFRKCCPYIPEEDICIETMSANSIVFIVEAFLVLHEYEKQFKKFVKKGYGSISCKGRRITAYPPSYTKEQVLKESDGGKAFFSLNDFITMQN